MCISYDPPAKFCMTLPQNDVPPHTKFCKTNTENTEEIGSLICMIMAVYSGHKMISGNKRTIKQMELKEVEE